MKDSGATEGGPTGAHRAPPEADRLVADIEELRRSRARLVLAADRERRAIERVLHDGLQQQLIAIAIDLRRAADLVAADPAAGRTVLDALGADVGRAIDEAASLAQTIHPPRMLEVRSLASAVRSAAEQAGVTVDVRTASVTKHPPELIDAVYRTCTEVLSAAPAGTAATITVTDAADGVRFEIAVTGGYPAGRVEGLRDRVEALGGRLMVEDDVEGGSRVTGTLPRDGPDRSRPDTGSPP